jgi:hypothetical protein
VTNLGAPTCGVGLPLRVVAVMLLCLAALSADDKKPAPARPASPPPRPAPRAVPAPAGRGPASAPVNRGAPPAPVGRGTPSPGNQSGGPAVGGRGVGPATTGRGTTPGYGGQGQGAPAAGRGTNPTTFRRGTTPTTFGRGAANGSVSRGAAPAISRSGAPVQPNERVVHAAGGGEIHRGPDGRVHEIHARGMEIQRGPGVSRTVIRERENHVVVVSNHYGHGYIQHPYTYRGVELVHRTYYVNNVAYVHIYRPYFYYGVPLHVYVPRVYYAPVFYGWVYNPWVVPVAYPWGWVGNPWYVYYGPYFTPYPVYASPSLWLTDYFVGQTLQAAYQERSAELANAQPPAGTAPMTPEVKQAIAEEVRRQIALENSEGSADRQAPPDPGSSGIARMLADNASHVFVVSAPLELTSNRGDCPVTEGDVLQLNPGTPPNATAANLIVVSSKGQDCVRGSAVTVGVADLQDMQNHMRETIDQGLTELQKRQGQNGIPAAPAGATQPPVQTAFAAIAPPPDPNVAAELSQQTREADQAEREALSQEGATGPATEPVALPPSTSTSSPTTLTLALGQSPEEVISILGQPKNIVNLGSKKIYVFPDIKVTFTNGKATDIQ